MKINRDLYIFARILSIVYRKYIEVYRKSIDNLWKICDEDTSRNKELSIFRTWHSCWIIYRNISKICRDLSIFYRNISILYRNLLKINRKHVDNLLKYIYRYFIENKSRFIQKIMFFWKYIQICRYFIEIYWQYIEI